MNGLQLKIKYFLKVFKRNFKQYQQVCNAQLYNYHTNIFKDNFQFILRYFF